MRTTRSGPLNELLTPNTLAKAEDGGSTIKLPIQDLI